MTENGDTSSLLDLYLDGMLPEDQRLEFERRLEVDPDLRAQLEAQESIDASLKSLFSPPAAPQVPVQEARPEPRPIRLIDHLRRSRWVAIAAMLLIAISAWRIWDLSRSGPSTDPLYQTPAWESMEMAYHQQVNHGFVPKWKCENNQQMASAFWNNLGHALVSSDPIPEAIAGLSYANVLSPHTMMALVKSGNDKIIVFVDTDSNPKALKMTPNSDLHIYTKEIGPLKLYEVSRLPEPHALDLFHPIQMPEAWKKDAWKFKF